MRRKIKGRIVTVDDKTIKIVEDLNIWGAKLPKKDDIQDGTFIDIMNDMLNISIGDYVILWKKCF